MGLLVMTKVLGWRCLHILGLPSHQQVHRSGRLCSKEAKVEEKKSYIRTLQSGNEKVVVNAIQNKSDVSFYILKQEESEEEKDGKKVKVVKTMERGGSTKFPTMAEATVAVDKVVADLIASGWKAPDRIGGGGGFKAKTDTFSLSNLPKPKATPAATAKPVQSAPKKP